MKYVKHVLIIILMLLAGNWIMAQNALDGEELMNLLFDKDKVHLQVLSIGTGGDISQEDISRVKDPFREEGFWLSGMEVLDLELSLEYDHHHHKSDNPDNDHRHNRHNDGEMMLYGEVKRSRTFNYFALWDKDRAISKESLGKDLWNKISIDDNPNLKWDSWFIDLKIMPDEFLLANSDFSLELNDRKGRVELGSLGIDTHWKMEYLLAQKSDNLNVIEEKFRKTLQNMLNTSHSEEDPFLLFVTEVPEVEARETTLTGRISNPESQSVLIQLHPGMPEQFREVPLQPSGKFSIPLELEKGQRIHICHPNHKNPLALYMEPGRNLYFEAKGNDIAHPTLFEGEGAPLNEFLHTFYKKFRDGDWDTDPYPGWSQSNLAEAALTSLKIKEKKDLECAYIKENSLGLPADFLYWLTAEIYYRHAYLTMFHDQGEGSLNQFDAYTQRPSFEINPLSPVSPQVKLQGVYWYTKFMSIHYKRKMWALNRLRVGSPKMNYAAEDIHQSFGSLDMIYSGFPLAWHMKMFIGEALTEGKLSMIEYAEKNSLSLGRPSTRDRIHDMYGTLDDKFEHRNLLPHIDDLFEDWHHTEEGNHPPHLPLSNEEDDYFDFSEYEGHNVLLVFYREFMPNEKETLKAISQKYDHYLYTVYIPFRLFDSYLLYKNGRDVAHLPGIHLPELPVGHSAISEYRLSPKDRVRFFMIDPDGHFVSGLPTGSEYADWEMMIKERLEPISSFWQKFRGFIFFLLGNLVLISFLLWIGIRWWSRRLKRRELAKREVVETQLKAIRSQMNPHFLFNSLNAIQNLVNRGEADKANEYLSSFSTLMRRVLHNSDQAFIPIEEELEVVKRYCELESLRTPFEFSLLVDPAIDTFNTEIPGMLIQPHVENAIVHGIKGMGPEAKIEVKLKQEIGYLLCIIEDNGIGINATMGKNPESGYGIRLTQDRVLAMGPNANDHPSVLVTDLSEEDVLEKGTRVEIWVPLEE